VFRSYAVDALLGAGVAAIALVAGATGIGPDGPDGRAIGPGAVALAAVLVAALAVRRRAPLVTVVATNAITMAWFLIGYPGRLLTLGPLIACYTVAARRGWRWGAAGGLLTVAFTAVTVRVALNGEWLSDQVYNAVMLEVATVALGAAVHSHRAYAAGAREQAERIAEARAEQARRRAAEQRLEIARELHDVFGHTMAAISVQAGVAVHVMRRRPEQAAEALTTIKQISDEGLAEVQTLLGVLRGAGNGGTPGGLGRLDSLLDVARAAGIRANLTVRGDRRALPPAVDLAAFRIVQESLTNVRRHANAETVCVELTYHPDNLDITVRDNGSSAGPSGSTPAGGNGIRGMLGRATALGGALTAGPGAGGGFEVRCWLPTKEVS
jgi:signal transduction histidine kinase